MERISDEQLEKLINSMFDFSVAKANVHSALTELRERRALDAPCPEHAKIVVEMNRTGYMPNFECPSCHDFMVRQEVDCIRCIKCHWTNVG
jgi:hypothetical protein